MGETEEPYKQENLKRRKMNKYLIKASYNANGVKGLIQDGGTKRRAEVQKMIAVMGGKLESFYFAFGEQDAYITVELPDHVSAAAVGLGVNASGVVSISTTVLLSPEDIDAASKVSVNYRGPGQK
jgi:uncharacterized protein with GYD domain